MVTQAEQDWFERPIRAVSWQDEQMYEEVGVGRCISIAAFRVTGQMAVVPWFRITFDDGRTWDLNGVFAVRVFQDAAPPPEDGGK